MKRAYQMSIAVVLFSMALGLAQASPKSRRTTPQQIVELQLDRARVAQAVKAGPQAFIAQLRVIPARDASGAFVGFKIIGFTADAPLLNNRHLQAGDIVLAVNRESLERPAQFMRAWEVATSADVVEVSVLRGSRRILYRWKIKG